jgi:hypothetical protein
VTAALTTTQLTASSAQLPDAGTCAAVAVAGGRRSVKVVGGSAQDRALRAEERAFVLTGSPADRLDAGTCPPAGMVSGSGCRTGSPVPRCASTARASTRPDRLADLLT